MTERQEIDRLVRELYSARVRGDVDGVCKLFSGDADFRIAGASHASPLAITATGIGEIRSWMALMIKTFQIDDQQILTMLIDGARAAVHWRAIIHSRITGTAVSTELVDLIQVRDSRIASYTEFFAPR